MRYFRKDKNNAASGLINLARNIGGSVGISVVTTMLGAPRPGITRSSLLASLNSGSATIAGAIAATTRMLCYARFEPTLKRLTRPTRSSPNLLDQQATMLAYIDNFWMLGVAVAHA